eukprot:COSAG06_NODE_38159_length_426_cov_1.571865_1_plen_99_part_10
MLCALYCILCESSVLCAWLACVALGATRPDLLLSVPWLLPAPPLAVAQINEGDCSVTHRPPVPHRLTLAIAAAAAALAGLLPPTATRSGRRLAIEGIGT